MKQLIKHSIIKLQSKIQIQRNCSKLHKFACGYQIVALYIHYYAIGCLE